MNTFDLTSKILNFMDRKKIRSIGRKSTMWPSQARAGTPLGVVGKCLRDSYWTKTNVEPTNPVNQGVKLMGFMGIQSEDGLIDICTHLGLWRGNNIKWYNEEENVSGEIDVVVGVPKADLIAQNFSPEILSRFEDEEEILFNIECKSCSGYFINKSVFGYYEGRGQNRSHVPGKPKDPHLMQSALYTDITYDKCAGTILIYFSRDEAKMKQFLITTDPEKNIYIDGEKELRYGIQEIYQSYRTLQEFLDKEELPACDYAHTYSEDEVKDLYARKEISKAACDNHLSKKKIYRDSACTYCNYLDKCMALSTPQEEIPEGFAHGSY